MKLFDHDSGIMRFLGRVTDLAILNVVALIFCLPIFTIGASLTATHYVAIRMKRGTEGYVIPNFWKSFKENLKQSTGIWFILSILTAMSSFGVFVMMQTGGTFNSIVSGILLVGLLGCIFTTMWAYPLQSKFVNPVKGTLRNALFFGVRYIFRTLYMVMMNLLPVVVLLLGWRTFPFVFLFGISLPVYFSTFVYNKIFEDLEEQILEKQREEQGEPELGDWEAAEQRAIAEAEAESKR